MAVGECGDLNGADVGDTGQIVRTAEQTALDARSVPRRLSGAV